MSALAVTQLGIENFGEFVSDLFIFGIHELRDENTWKESCEIIELDGEFSKLPVRNISRAKPGEIGIIDRTMPEHEAPHVLMECHETSRTRYREGEARLIVDLAR